MGWGAGYHGAGDRPMPTLEQRLSLLEDKREILRTLHDYGHCLDYGDEAGFMDCWMPVKSGIEVTRILRALPDEKIRNVPIIALTANAQKSDADDCREAGMDEFMTKPLSFQMLVEKLGAFLGSDKVPRRWRGPGHDGRA